MSQQVLLETCGTVAVLSLNRPERHNSLVPDFLQEILITLENIRAKPDIAAVVLQASGRTFSTGGDLRGFYDHLATIRSYANQVVGLLNGVILALVDLPVPVVAAVHGIVTGGSLGLVLAADVVLVAPEASFTPYYSVVGFSPDGGWTAWLPEIIGVKRAAEILMRNQTITAEQAVTWGLANRIVPAERIHEEALRTAKDIGAKQPGSIQRTKRLLSLPFSELAGRLETERSAFVEQIMREDAQRSMIAFLERLQKA